MKTFLFTLLLFAAGAFALDFQNDAINVKGTAKVSVEPDIANFRLGMTIKHKQIDSALAKIGKITEAVSAVFKKYKLDKNTAKIRNIQIVEDKEYDRETRNQVFKGYQAKRYYEIKFSKLEKLSKFLLEVHAAGANDLNQFSFTHTKADSIENSLLKKAIKNAKKSAKVAAKSAGVKIQKVSVISDQPPRSYAYQNRVDFEMPGFGDSRAKSGRGSADARVLENKVSYSALFEIEPGKIEITKSVWVTYKIK